MPTRKYRPTSPGIRHRTDLTNEDLSKTSGPHRPLTKRIKSAAGRNSRGKITAYCRGGGHRRKYRLIDFKREKTGIPAKVTHIEYDPNRTARIALLCYADGEKRYIIAPDKLAVGDVVVSGQGSDIKPGNTLPLKNIPLGGLIHSVELRPGQGRAECRGRGAAHGPGRQVRAGEAPLGRGENDSGGVHRHPRAGRQHRPGESQAR